jgi:CubicO group peptidase (beta-lactamase class C family)
MLAKSFSLSLAFAGLCAICMGQYKAASIPVSNTTESVLKYSAVADSMVLSFARENHLPGVAYGIVMNGELIYSKYEGYTDLSKSTKVKKSSTFRIASMTKSFTSMAILILRDQGKLNLDEPASKYIPEMKSIKYLSTDAPAITIRDLMTHRAGFPEDNPYGDRQLGDTDAELLKFYEGEPRVSPMRQG